MTASENQIVKILPPESLNAGNTFTSCSVNEFQPEAVGTSQCEQE